MPFTMPYDPSMELPKSEPAPPKPMHVGREHHIHEKIPVDVHFEAPKAHHTSMPIPPPPPPPAPIHHKEHEKETEFPGEVHAEPEHHMHFAGPEMHFEPEHHKGPDVHVPVVHRVVQPVHHKDIKIALPV